MQLLHFKALEAQLALWDVGGEARGLGASRAHGWGG